MSFGKTHEKRMQAARKHADREHICKCGKVIKGNSYFNHIKHCKVRLNTESSFKCGNCGTYRMVRDNYIVEKCPYCGDDEYEIGGESNG